MIVALAGRRPDQKDALILRFPEANEELVRERIRAILEQYEPDIVVASAAAGADLIGLEVAGEQGIRCRVILPHTVEHFRAQSVADRGEHWGRRFDAVRSQVEPAGDLRVYPAARENEPDQEAYLGVVQALLDESLALAGQELEGEGAVSSPPSSRVMALVIWDGVSSGEDDMTAAFISEAEARGIAVEEISTV